MINPFIQIEERFDKLEKMILELQAASFGIKTNPTEALPTTGDINLAISITGLKKSTIYKMTSTGEIPFSKPSGKLIFVSQDLLKWIESNSKY